VFFNTQAGFDIHNSAGNGTQVIATAVPSGSGTDLPEGVVTLDPSGPDMIAHFTPDNGMSISQAAALGGFTHFDWVQFAVQYPGSTIGSPPQSTPFLDPPLGGWNNQKADNLPFYWDETNAPGLDQNLSLSDNIVGNVLQFIDEPVDSFVIPGVNSMEFYTSLVGVRSDGSWTPLYSWSWDSDTGRFIAGGGVTLLRNVESIPGTVGGVFDVQALASSADAPRSLVEAWEQSGATGVPEPSTWVMAILGCYGLGWAVRRRRSRPESSISMLPHSGGLKAAMSDQTR